MNLPPVGGLTVRWYMLSTTASIVLRAPKHSGPPTFPQPQKACLKRQLITSPKPPYEGCARGDLSHPTAFFGNAFVDSHKKKSNVKKVFVTALFVRYSGTPRSILFTADTYRCTHVSKRTSRFLANSVDRFFDSVVLDLPPPDPSTHSTDNKIHVKYNNACVL